MQKFISCIISLAVTTLCFSQQQGVDCSKFKKGNFLYKDSSGITWDIKRTMKHQIERNKTNGTIIRHKINWVSDCEYKLTQIWSNDKNRRKLNRSWIIYRITVATDKTYEYSCTCKDGRNISGIVVKLTY